MRTSILIAYIILVTFIAQGKSSISWLQVTHNFGTFKEELGKVSCDFKVVNTGDNDIRITNVRPICGCTASAYTVGAIHPGDTATVTLTFDPKGRPGKFNKDAYVYFEGVPKRSKLLIRGNVIGSQKTIQDRFPVGIGVLKLNNRIIPLGEIKKGKSKTDFINAYNQSSDSLNVVFSNVPEHISVEMIPSVIPPGEDATITVTYHSRRASDWGLSQNSISVNAIPASSTDSAAAGNGSIDVTAIVLEDFSALTEKEKLNPPVAKLSAEKVDFGKIDTSNTVVSQEFTITNSGKSNLLIRRIYSLDEGVTIKCDKNELKKGKSATVKVDVDTSALKKMLNAKVVVITNDPNNPQQSVRLVGLIPNN